MDRDGFGEDALPSLYDSPVMHELHSPIEMEGWFSSLVRASQDLSEAAILLENRPADAQMIRTMRNAVEQFLREQLRKEDSDEGQSVR